MSTEREAVARAICEADGYVDLKGEPPDWRPWLPEADAAIAALDAHRAGQVCVWERVKSDPPGSVILRSPHDGDIHISYDVCPDCGKRVEVKNG